MNKRAIAILGAIFILIVGAVGFLIYRSTASTDTESEDPIVTEKPNDIPIPTPFSTPEPTFVLEPTPEPTVAARAIRLTDNSVISPILLYNATGISYLERTGQLFQTDLQITDTTVLLSNKRELSIALKNNIYRVIWPEVGDSFIAEFEGLGRKSWSYFDPIKAAYVDIPGQVYSLDWMPTGDKIMFVWVDENKKAFLNISNPDTTEYQVLTDFYEPDNIIKVAPDGKNVLFYRNQTSDLSKNTINMVSADGKTFKTVIQEGYNRGVKWSPDSSKFLFTKRDSSGKFMLWVATIATGEVRNLGVATSVNKVVWSKDNQYIFAGVPTKGTADESLTEDVVYKMNVLTPERTQFEPGVPADTQEMFLSRNEEILFFKNAQDQALYYIDVRQQGGFETPPQ